MNILNTYTQQPKTQFYNNIQNLNKTKTSFKKKEDKEYTDPLKRWPAKGLAYSNELGAVVSGVSPKLGTALWVPALMYFGADIYDKYKNDDKTYSPSKKRGVKEAVFQALASVFLPTSAVALGQRVASSANRLAKTGLSTQAKLDVLDKSLTYMQSASLHTFADNPEQYAEGFKSAIIHTSQGAKGDFKALPLFKRILAVINPLKDSDNIAFAKEQKLGEYAKQHAEKLMRMREQLMQDKKPKELSQKLFEKFQTIKGQYAKIYPADKYMGKAAKSILKDYHASQIFKNKMIKTAGGFVALALLAKPIDNFVEKIVIKKTVEPGLDYISKEYNNQKALYYQNRQKRFEEKISQPQAHIAKPQQSKGSKKAKNPKNVKV